MAEGGGLLNRYRVVKPYRGFESLRLRQPLIAWSGERDKAQQKRVPHLAAKQRRRAGLHFYSPITPYLPATDHFLTHCEQIDALVLLPILEINETGTT